MAPKPFKIALFIRRYSLCELSGPDIVVSQPSRSRLIPSATIASYDNAPLASSQMLHNVVRWYDAIAVQKQQACSRSSNGGTVARPGYVRSSFCAVNGSGKGWKRVRGKRAGSTDNSCRRQFHEAIPSSPCAPTMELCSRQSTTFGACHRNPVPYDSNILMERKQLRCVLRPLVRGTVRLPQGSSVVSCFQH